MENNKACFQRRCALSPGLPIMSHSCHCKPEGTMRNISMVERDRDSFSIWLPQAGQAQGRKVPPGARRTPRRLGGRKRFPEATPEARGSSQSTSRFLAVAPHPQPRQADGPPSRSCEETRPPAGALEPRDVFPAKVILSPTPLPQTKGQTQAGLLRSRR